MRPVARLGVVLGTCVALVAGTPAAAGARTVAEFWQVNIQMAPQLWDDGNGLPFMMGDELDTFTLGATNYRIAWANASSTTPEKYLLGSKGQRNNVATAALRDRPLKPGALKRYRLTQRLLWLDADVLVAPEGSALCGGVSDAGLRQILAGQDPSVRLRVATDSTGSPRWAFGRNSFGATAIRTTDGGLLGVTGAEAAVAKLSFVHTRLAGARLCAVPVDGVTPSEQTTRDRSYRYAYGVYYVSRKNPTKGLGAKPAPLIKRWEQLLFGPMGDEYLTSALGRVRFLP
jgi:hypothetical protein